MLSTVQTLQFRAEHGTTQLTPAKNSLQLTESIRFNSGKNREAVASFLMVRRKSPSCDVIGCTALLATQLLLAH